MAGRTVRELPARAALLAAGALAARGALAAVRAVTERHRRPTPRWARVNYRGATVNLAGGPALAGAVALTGAAGAAGARAAAPLVATAGAGLVGLYDDLVGGRPGQRAKGFHGHLAALRQGRVTSGVVKLAGIGAAGVSAAVLLETAAGRRSGPPTPTAVARVLLGAGVVAGTANLFNLLDLRPGRALKAGLLVGVPLVTGPAGGMVAGPVGAAGAMLPPDLAERTMLGDCGANALGAAVGTALAASAGLTGRALTLAVVAGLTAASERVSFTRVIARTPGLRELDEWGRPAAATGGPDG